MLPYLATQRIVALELEESWAHRTLYFCFRDHRSLSLAARQLVDELALPTG